MKRHLSRLVWVLVAASGLGIATAPPALADAAGPTDYRSEIVSIEPPTSALKVEMIGGDSFISLELLDPVEVIVIGYFGEPYLRFSPQGEVFENLRSPSRWLNQDRYGAGEPPAYSDAGAAPEWLRVSESGSYAWHDHRSHWMNPNRPPGAEAGDQVLEASVPLVVAGTDVDVTVASYLLAAPAIWPTAVGVLVGAAMAGLALRSDRIGRMAPTAALAAGALALGGIAYRSVPVETAPSPLLWLLPLMALAAALFVIAVRNHLTTTVYLDGLATAAGAVLLVWGVNRFDGLRRALIPSDAPGWVDRFVIAATLVMGAVIAAQGVAGLLRPKRLKVA